MASYTNILKLDWIVKAGSARPCVRMLHRKGDVAGTRPDGFYCFLIEFLLADEVHDAEDLGLAFFDVG